MPRVASAILSLRPRTLLLAVIASALVPIVPAGASRAVEMASNWRTREISIDGDDRDWRGLTSPVERQRFALGLANDSEALYLCLVTTDYVSRTQIARQGLIVWFDRDGHAKQRLGVQFPMDVGNWSPAIGQREVPEEPAVDAAPARGDVRRETLGLLGPRRKDVRRVEMAQAEGILAQVRVRGDVLVYELRVPLSAEGPGGYAVNAEPGSMAHLQLQTPEWRGPLPSTFGPIRAGVGVEPVPGRPGVMYPARDTSLLRPLDVSLDVRLATAR